MALANELSAILSTVFVKGYEMAHLEHDPTLEPDGLTLADLAHVAPLGARVNAAGHMEVAGVDLVDLATAQGTALYVMDEAHIRAQLNAYQAALAECWPESAVAYAGKAFTCKAICRLLTEEGGWLDASSGGELAIALAAGFAAEQVIFHGNNKTEQELIEAIEAGIGRIVLDCFEEIERVQRLAADRGVVQKVLLRIKPGVVADTHSHIITGAEDSKFGFGISDGWAERATEQVLEAANLELMGLHCHIGSQIFAIDVYQQAVGALFRLLGQLKQRFDYLPRELNLGGGVGSAYRVEHNPPSISDFVKTLTDAVKIHCEQLGLAPSELKLIVEPGRSIVANAGITLYTVGAIKQLEGIRTFVAVDGGMTDNIRTALYDARYECVIANRVGEPRDAIVTVAGKHCESGDVVMIDASIQTPQVGDTLVIMTTGAYNQSMSSNYNKQPRPAVVWLADGVAREVVRRETYADLLATDVG
ncbi:MAG: diaminopimelate decarboxylase [Coriobacteriia bacterium]|nr:diaminopimelate decarboxylase [Coriobacteriia bacterium]